MISVQTLFGLISYNKLLILYRVGHVTSCRGCNYVSCAQGTYSFCISDRHAV